MLNKQHFSVQKTEYSLLFRSWCLYILMQGTSTATQDSPAVCSAPEAKGLRRAPSTRRTWDRAAIGRLQRDLSSPLQRSAQFGPTTPSPGGCFNCDYVMQILLIVILHMGPMDASCMHHLLLRIDHRIYIDIFFFFTKHHYCVQVVYKNTKVVNFSHT